MINHLQEKSKIHQNLKKAENHGMIFLLLFFVCLFFSNIFYFSILGTLLFGFLFVNSYKSQKNCYQQLNDINNDLFNSCATKIKNHEPLSEDDLLLIEQSKELQMLLNQENDNE